MRKKRRVLEGSGFDAGVLDGGVGDLGGLGAVEGEGVGVLGLLGLLLGLVEMGLQLHDGGGPHALYGPVLLRHNRRLR